MQHMTVTKYMCGLLNIISEGFNNAANGPIDA